MKKYYLLISLLLALGFHSVRADEESEPRLKYKKAWKQQFNSLFDSMFEPMEQEGFGLRSFQFPNSMPDIRKLREDDKYIYYDLSINGSKPGKVDVNVQEGQIEITGSIVKQNFHSSFHRSFPAPAGVDANRAELTNEGGKLVLKLPKK